MQPLKERQSRIIKNMHHKSIKFQGLSLPKVRIPQLSMKRLTFRTIIIKIERSWTCNPQYFIHHQLYRNLGKLLPLKLYNSKITSPIKSKTLEENKH